MAFKISKGKQVRPQKVVIYGPEGIGKSTLAAQFPEPVFLDVEGGTAQLDVARVDNIPNWNTLVSYVREFAKSDDAGKTLIIDTADWAERMCIDYVLKKNSKSSIEDFGYGKGYTYIQDEYKNILDAANECIQRGKNVVFLAHAKMRKFEQPDEMGAYDRWEMKLSRQVAPVIKEWADMVLFLNFQTVIVEDSKTKSKKAQGGKRVIYTSHHPCWDAKNRHGFPDKMPLQWEGPLADVFTTTIPLPLQQAQVTLGGEVDSTIGKDVQPKMSNAAVVKQLAANSNFDEEDVMKVLRNAEMCDASLTSIEDVPEDILEVVIQKWEEFKTYIDVPFK